MNSGWERIGSITVDAGLCWIGDPCYVFGDERPGDIGENWHAFCERLFSREQLGAAQWGHSPGNTGLGVTVGTGYGDGEYGVYAKRKDGRIMAVMVDLGGDDTENE